MASIPDMMGVSKALSWHIEERLAAHADGLPLPHVDAHEGRTPDRLRLQLVEHVLGQFPLALHVALPSDKRRHPLGFSCHDQAGIAPVPSTAVIQLCAGGPNSGVNKAKGHDQQPSEAMPFLAFICPDQVGALGDFHCSTTKETVSNSCLCLSS